ncbi:hypothetical protein T484DRAFT_1799183 [Baffinella frigidus]|nr:hypothetical protein T484DRAFT_1799183 [Cryptophyta sp. CCMP2293]
MASAPTPIPATPDAAADAAAQSGTARHSAQSDATPDASASNFGAGGIAVLFSAVEKDTADEVILRPVSSGGFVDEVIPRRRGDEPRVVLTRELLASYHHESLDAVAEILGLSKTTIKAACRKLGLPKWPYQHTGPRKRRMRVTKHEEQPAESAHERTLKDTFHTIMGKRQRVEEVQIAPTVAPALPLTFLPGTTLADLQAMQTQSISWLSAMVATLNASATHLPLNASFQGPPLSVQPPPIFLGGNFGGNFGGNYTVDFFEPVQGNLAHKKPPPPRTLQ